MALPISKITTKPTSGSKAATPKQSAFKMKMQGFSAAEVARVHGVSERTVYRWWKEHAAEYAETIKDQRPINIIAEHITALDEMERLALRTHHRSSGVRDQLSALAAARQARQMKIDLQLKVGALPTSPSQLYVSVDDTASKAMGISAQTKPATREEAIQKITELLIHERRMPEFSGED
ncbi:MAG: helix-turn-helix domain-containing protein [Boseongicola sp.]|nr:helix-turn-helix domain-containing protein [Boseongicola sp.]